MRTNKANGEKVGVSQQTIINLIKSKNKFRKKNMHFKYA